MTSHGATCAMRMGYLTPTPLQQAVLEHASTGNVDVDVRVLRARPRTGKTVAVVMGALLGIETRVRQVQSVLLCSTLEQRDHTTWTTCRMLGANGGRIRVATVGASYGGEPSPVTAHVLIGCTGALHRMVKNHPTAFERVRFVAVHDADILFGTTHTTQIA